MKCTRREVLHALWGAPLLGSAVGCKRARNLPGSLGGADHQVGHLLRDVGALLAAPHDAPTFVGVAIVGAGPAGLSAAWELQGCGEHDYLVFDLEAYPGGTSHSESTGVVPHPWGAHYVPLPRADNPDLVRLLDEMGVLQSTLPPSAKETELVRAPDERLFIDGEWQYGLFPHAGANANDLAQHARFIREAQAFADFRDGAGRRAFTIPSALSSDAPELRALDRLSAAAWLAQRNYDSPRLLWFIEYACRDDYGTRLSQTSAWAMLFYFAARLESSRHQAPPFLTWPEGNGRLVAHLAKASAGRLKQRHLVYDIAQSEDYVELSVLVLPEKRLLRFRAQQVIAATPQFVTQRIVRDFRQAQSGVSDAFSYSAWLVANLHLSGRPRRGRVVDLAWDSVIYDAPGLGYIDASHQTLRDRGPTVWTYYHPLTQYDESKARRWLLAASREDLTEGLISELSEAHPDLLEYVTRVDIWRWGHAMARPTPGAIFSPDRLAAREPRGRLWFAHSDLSGFSLFEEAQYWGVRAARDVLRKRRPI